MLSSASNALGAATTGELALKALEVTDESGDGEMTVEAKRGSAVVPGERSSTGGGVGRQAGLLSSQTMHAPIKRTECRS